MAIKSEHNGAKNGGGYFGPRAEAKQVSKKKRRAEDVATRQNLVRWGREGGPTCAKQIVEVYFDGERVERCGLALVDGKCPWHGKD